MSCARRTCQVASRPDLAADWAILWAPALCWERPMGSIDTCCSAAIVSDVVDVVSAKDVSKHSVDAAAEQHMAWFFCLHAPVAPLHASCKIL